MVESARVRTLPRGSAEAMADPAGTKATHAARHYRIPALGDMPRKAPSAASGRRTGSDGALRLTPPDEHHHGAHHRLAGAGHRDVGEARVRRPRDAPGALDGHQPHTSVALPGPGAALEGRLGDR